MKKIQFGVLCGSIFLAILLLCMKIAVVTLFTSGGVVYSQIEAETQSLQKENIVLKEKIFSQASYFTIASEAAAMGFTYSDKKSQIVFTNPAPIAYNQ